MPRKKEFALPDHERGGGPRDVRAVPLIDGGAWGGPARATVPTVGWGTSGRAVVASQKVCDQTVGPPSVGPSSCATFARTRRALSAGAAPLTPTTPMVAPSLAWACGRAGGTNPTATTATKAQTTESTRNIEAGSVARAFMRAARLTMAFSC
jgi:hypothetical protein